MNDMVEVVESDRVLFCGLFRVPGRRTNGVLAGDCDDREEMQALAMHRLAHSPGDGMVVVPVVPTEGMLDAYWRQTGESREMRSRTHAYMNRYWSAMIAAAGQGDGR